MSGKEDKGVLKLKGKVVEVLPNTEFRVQIEESEQILMGHISGRMRMHYIKLKKGDIVDIEVSPYDLTKGRITYRY